MQAVRENSKLRRIILLVLVLLVLLCLVGALLYNLFFGGGGGGPTDTPTPTYTSTSDGSDVALTPEPTETPTRVMEEKPTPTPKPMEEPTEESTKEPEPTPTKDSSADLDLPIISPGAVMNLLNNGDFEEGFGDQGIGADWQGFNTDGVAVVFSPEAEEPYVKSGESAQRITLAQAGQADRYAGIYQQVELVPGETYTLTLHGQVRSGFGDVNQSSYGYRMQYAIDPTGRKSWQQVPAETWVELPWDEQLLYSEDAEFLEYTMPITASTEQLTLFIRAWNKWAEPSEAQYTLDDLSLVGPSPVAGQPDEEEEMVDKPLPTTGTDAPSGFVGSGTFWGALLVLVLLAAGAIYRSKWSY